jgi:hypothetical protein
VLEKTGWAVELELPVVPLLPFCLPLLPISSALAAAASGGVWAGGGAEEELWRRVDPGAGEAPTETLPISGSSPSPVVGASTGGGLEQGTTTAVRSKGARTLGGDDSGTVVGPAEDEGASRSL